MANPLYDKRNEGHTRLSPKEALQQNLQKGDRVIYRVYGSGRVFPKGPHQREGTIIKSGHVEDCWFIQLDQPIGKETFVDAHPLDLELISWI